MSEQTVIETPAKPKRKKRTRHTAPRQTKADEFAGITESECCAACNVDRCVISGLNVCAHPFKGGLQASLTNNAAAMDRLNRAQKKLARRAIGG